MAENTIFEKIAVGRKNDSIPPYDIIKQEASLDVLGDTKLSGALKLEGKLEVAGNVELTGELTFSNQKNTNITVQVDNGLIIKPKSDQANKEPFALDVKGKIKENGSDLLPSGAVIMWYGDKIPEGWLICDGTNNTPDLRGRFVVGTYKKSEAPIDETKETKVSREKIENEIELKLDHKSKGGISRTTVKKSISGSGLDMGKEEYLYQIDTNNLPPFYALYYIMKK